MAVNCYLVPNFVFPIVSPVSFIPVFSSIAMPVHGRLAPYPDGIRGSYYYLYDDFRTWRYRFEALVGRYQWKNDVAKQFAFAYLRDMEGLRPLRTQRGAPRVCRHQPNKRKGLLKSRPERGIRAPIWRRPYVGSAGRMVHIPIHGGQLAEIALPLGTGDTGRRTAAGRRVFPHTGPEDSSFPGHRDVSRLVETQTAGPKDERDFLVGQ